MLFIPICSSTNDSLKSSYFLYRSLLPILQLPIFNLNFKNEIKLLRTMSHTILLMQPNRRQDSRSYADFESGWFSINGSFL